MKVTKNAVVTLDYHVKDIDGEIVDAGEEPLVYLHGHEDMFPLVEEALAGKNTGDTVTVKLLPQDAFGDYDESLIQIEPMDMFPSGLEVGMQFEGTPGDGDEGDEPVIYRVTDIADGKVVLDGNHPLAGQALLFTCTVTDIRPASPEEIAHGHVHGHESHSHLEH